MRVQNCGLRALWLWAEKSPCGLEGSRARGLGAQPVRIPSGGRGTAWALLLLYVRARFALYMGNTGSGEA